MPVPLGTNAAHLGTVGRGTLLAVVLLAPAALAWPSIEGWTALGIALAALLAVWLLQRSLAEHTAVPGHWMHLAMLSLWLLGTFHMLRGGMAGVEARPRPLGGQFEASLATQAAMIALMVLLAQDWLERGRLASILPTAAGLAAVGAALAGLLLGTRPESRLMLAMMGWTGTAMFCRPLWSRLTVLGDGDNRPGRRIGRSVRLGAAVAAAAGLAVLCPPGVVLALVAAAVTLLVAAVLVRAATMRYLALALLAATLAAAHARDLGWIRAPAWPPAPAAWIGRGGSALAAMRPWTSGLALLIDTIGWGGVAWLLGCLLIALARAMRAAIANDLHGRALLGGMTLVLATIAWLTPQGLFSPGINVLFAAVWALWPITMGLPTGRHSGWRVFAVVAALALVLALVGRIGLLSWMALSLGGDDIVLHLFVGWLMTQMLLWLLSPRPRGVLLAVAVSVLAAGLGEALQAGLSSRSAQWHDFFGHLHGTALATALYLVCRAALWSESPDMPARPDDPSQTGPKKPLAAAGGRCSPQGGRR
ncbi:MAG: hypothetical protein GX591_15330 [Planctomycetes bacterium]|nr:hypothetical protein [Planctomycetota bacterium]